MDRDGFLEEVRPELRGHQIGLWSVTFGFLFIMFLGRFGTETPPQGGAAEVWGSSWFPVLFMFLALFVAIVVPRLLADREVKMARREDWKASWWVRFCTIPYASVRKEPDRTEKRMPRIYFAKAVATCTLIACGMVLTLTTWKGLSLWMFLVVGVASVVAMWFQYPNKARVIGWIDRQEIETGN